MLRISAINSLTEMRVSIQRINTFLDTPEPPIPAVQPSRSLQTGSEPATFSEARPGIVSLQTFSANPVDDAQTICPVPRPPASPHKSESQSASRGCQQPEPTWLTGCQGIDDDLRPYGYVALRGADFSWDHSLGEPHRDVERGDVVLFDRGGHSGLNMGQVVGLNTDHIQPETTSTVSLGGQGALLPKLSFFSSKGAPAATGTYSGWSKVLKRDMSLFPSFRGMSRAGASVGDSVVDMGAAGGPRGRPKPFTDDSWAAVTSRTLKGVVLELHPGELLGITGEVRSKSKSHGSFHGGAFLSFQFLHWIAQCIQVGSGKSSLLSALLGELQPLRPLVPAADPIGLQEKHVIMHGDVGPSTPRALNTQQVELQLGRVEESMSLSPRSESFDLDLDLLAPVVRGSLAYCAQVGVESDLRSVPMQSMDV